MNKVLFSSKSDEWETPQDLFDELNKEFNFTLDVCATEINAKCKKYYTKEDNGLFKSWFNEIVFCNPPYSQISAWVKKSCYESIWSLTKCISATGGLCAFAPTVILLIPARTDTKWCHDYIYNKAEIRFIKGRLKFSNSKNSAPFPSMIVIFRDSSYPLTNINKILKI